MEYSGVELDVSASKLKILYPQLQLSGSELEPSGFELDSRGVGRNAIAQVLHFAPLAPPTLGGTGNSKSPRIGGFRGLSQTRVYTVANPRGKPEVQSPLELGDLAGNKTCLYTIALNFT